LKSPTFGANGISLEGGYPALTEGTRWKNRAAGADGWWACARQVRGRTYPAVRTGDGQRRLTRP